jgi:PAS domain S-box-containing protein
MPIQIRARPELRNALRQAIGDVHHEPLLVLLEWATSDEHTIEKVRLSGGAVLAICNNARREAEALGCGATEAITWPAPPELLNTRIKRAADIAYLPWLIRLHQLVDDSVEFTTPSVELLDVNPAFEHVTGYRKAAVLGKTTADLFRAEAHDPSYYAQIPHTLSTTGTWRGQLTARRQDGSLSFQQATISSVRDHRDVEIGHIAIKRDTSRNNLAWGALAGAESRMQMLVARAAEAVIIHSPAGKIADVNDSACILLGLDRDALLATHVASFDFGDDDLEARWASATDQPRILQSLWRSSDGNTFPVELSLGRAQLVGSDFILVLARDISGRKAKEAELKTVNAELTRITLHLEDEVAARTQELAAAAARLKATFSHLSDGLVAVRDDGRIERINPALLAMLGLPREMEWHGQSAQGLGMGLAALAQSATRQGMVCTIDLPLPGDRVGEATASPIVVEGRAEGAVVLVRDVTTAKEVDRMKTDFIATVSHELRTPLTSVLGFAKLARSKLERSVYPRLPDEPNTRKAVSQVQENLQIIVSEGKRLSDLINDVLDISKMESGRPDFRADTLDPGELLRHASQVSSSLFAAPDAPTLIVDVHPDLPTVIGDRDRLIQVLINLISNAVKFTPSGTVRLVARAVEDGIYWEVHDTGIGLHTQDLSTIFEKFKQAADTLTDKPQGTGLGLPISKNIVELHLGHIAVRSERGKGSTFTVWLPADRSIGTPSVPLPPPDTLNRLLDQIGFEAASKPSADIIVVDDEPSVRELLKQVLQGAGHRIRMAEDGASAIAAVRQRKPDLVVLDVMMPGLSGYDVTAVMRADPDLADVPILMVSVMADTQRGLRVGVDRYLRKPMQPHELLQAAGALLRRIASPRRLLVVAEHPDQRQYLRELLESRGSEVLADCPPDSAIQRVRMERPDLVVVGPGAPSLAALISDDPNLGDIAVLVLV